MNGRWERIARALAVMLRDGKVPAPGVRLAPFRSEAQRKWMYANDPEMAEDWEAETPKGEKLPERVGKP